MEVCEGLHRKTPPEMITPEELPQWKAIHENSTAGLFASIFSYPTPDLAASDVGLFGISTINPIATVKNQPKNDLKTRLKHQMGRKWASFRAINLSHIYATCIRAENSYDR
jgi:hypothetical protein